jgi:hypothetical protein
MAKGWRQMSVEIDGLTEQVVLLNRNVSDLRSAVDRRTRTRTVVTLSAAMVLALVAVSASLMGVHRQVSEHAAHDHESWCLVWRLLDDKTATERASDAGCRT